MWHCANDASSVLYLYTYIYIYSDLCNELDPMQNTLYTFIFNNNIHFTFLDLQYKKYCNWVLPVVHIFTYSSVNPLQEKIRMAIPHLLEGHEPVTL